MIEELSNITLGSMARDKVTGFKGIVIGIAVYLYGTKQVLLAANSLKDSLPIAPIWFDESRIIAEIDHSQPGPFL